MSSKHTKTPWRVEYKHSGTYIFSNEPNCLILSMSHTKSTQECNANAVRIAECVNAMENIENPKTIVQENKELKIEILTLNQQLGELLSSLQKAVPYIAESHKQKVIDIINLYQS